MGSTFTIYIKLNPYENMTSWELPEVDEVDKNKKSTKNFERDFKIDNTDLYQMWQPSDEERQKDVQIVYQLNQDFFDQKSLAMIFSSGEDPEKAGKNAETMENGV